MFTALLYAILAGTVLGGVMGGISGESIAVGAVQGSNIIGNAYESIISLTKGEWTKAGLQISGVSDQVIKDFLETPDVFADRRRGSSVLGGYQYEDPDKHASKLGWDAIMTGATIIGGAVIAKYGGKAVEVLGSAGMYMYIGQAVGKFQSDMGRISDALEDMILEMNTDDYQQWDYSTIWSDVFGTSGSASRYDRKDMDQNIDIGDQVDLVAEAV